MGDLLRFQNPPEPIYCAEDLEEYVGFRIEGVSSGECGENVYLMLSDDRNNKRVLIDINRALDGETLFLIGGRWPNG